MNDILTMIWKESKDIFFQGGWSALLRPLLLIGIMGVGFPLRYGLEWLTLSPLAMVVVIWVPFFVIITFIGDAIAGERERHTLETLLASRISDRAILVGKIIVTVAYAWGMAILGLLVGFLLVNLFAGSTNWAFYYPLDIFFDALALTLLTSILSTSAGVLISLRSATVRQAQQTLSIGTIVLVFASVFALRTLPASFFLTYSYSQILLMLIAIIAVLDIILLTLSLLSFRRSRLILS